MYWKVFLRFCYISLIPYTVFVLVSILGTPYKKKSSFNLGIFQTGFLVTEINEAMLNYTDRNFTKEENYVTTEDPYVELFSV